MPIPAPATHIFHSALVEAGPGLVDTFVHGAALLERAVALEPGTVDWLTRLDELVEGTPATVPGAPSPPQSDLFEQYTRVLGALARQAPLVLVVDDLQWADAGSISLLFHLGRQLASSRILIVGAYRPEEVAHRSRVLLRCTPSTTGVDWAARATCWICWFT
jgi:hypothetical protein